VKILLLADEECKSLWDYYRPGMFDEYGLILAAGDLRSDYLTFIVTLSNKPLVYVPGNHDGRYDVKPPEGCICCDDDVVTVKGIRIMGLGGSAYYNGGKHQYTEKDMERRIGKLRGKVAKAGGVDIILTHAAPRGLGDDSDYCHRGFDAFLPLMERLKPVYLVHGHVHLNYGQRVERLHYFQNTTIINAYQKYEIEVDVPMKETKAVRRSDKLLAAAEKVKGMVKKLCGSSKDYLAEYNK